MLFNSVSFLIFFPITALIYFIIPHKLRWIWLLLTSYYFYMSWNAKYALLIGVSTLITYASGLLIEKADKIKDLKRQVRVKKIWVTLSLVSNLAILVFFKYSGFLIENINLLLQGLHIELVIPKFDILLPVGISFYTFQALGYTLDVYRGTIRAEKNLGKYALFVSFFPQLVAGPIERSENLISQIHEEHKFSFDAMRKGLMLALWGLFQKMVIADRVAVLVNTVYQDYAHYSGSILAFATLLFAVQIYCDFSGYSDVAIGVAQCMGFRLMQNFRQPYFARSIADFWRRWHISLSTWFRDYIYIPLGGNRCSRIKRYRNLMITFLVSGLWHGASWNYIIWGGLHGLFQILGNLLLPFRKKFLQVCRINSDSLSQKFIQMVFTFVLVDFAWIFFRAPDLHSACGIIGGIFSSFEPWILFDGSLYKLGLSAREFWLMLYTIAVLLAVSCLRTKIHLREKIVRFDPILRWTLYYIAIFSIIIFGVYGSAYEVIPFIYFQF